MVWRSTLADKPEYNVHGMKRPWWTAKRFKWAAIGGMLSFLGPLGEWGFVSLFAGQIDQRLPVSCSCGCIECPMPNPAAMQFQSEFRKSSACR